MDFLGFKSLTRLRRKNLPKQVNQVVQDVAKVFLVKAADLTPVDTGAAISNWRVGINNSPSGVIPPYAPGRFSSTAIENLNATIKAGLSICETSMPGDKIHIVNNLHYIADLDTGSSKQAPAGMTALAKVSASRVQLTAKVVEPK